MGLRSQVVNPRPPRDAGGYQHGVAEVLAAGLYRLIVGGGCGIVLGGALLYGVDAALHRLPCRCCAASRMYFDLLGRLDSTHGLYQARRLHEVCRA